MASEQKYVMIDINDFKDQFIEVIKASSPSDIAFAFLHKINRFSLYNNSDMQLVMQDWKESAKQGKITVLECNNKTREINGKDFYILTITLQPNTEMVDPIGLALNFMVNGWVYVFRRKSNRDAVFNYVKKFCKNE